MNQRTKKLENALVFQKPPKIHKDIENIKQTVRFLEDKNSMQNLPEFQVERKKLNEEKYLK